MTEEGGADKMTIRHPVTGERRYLVDEQNQVEDVRMDPHEHVIDPVLQACRVCGKTASFIALTEQKPKEA
jgi:hypothetical protein